MTYSKEQKQALHQAGQLFKYMKNIQKNIDKPSGQVAWAELHFSGNVPKVKDKPLFSDYNLPDNVEELIENEKVKTKEKIEHGNKQKKYIVLAVVSLLPIIFFFCFIS